MNVSDVGAAHSSHGLFALSKPLTLLLPVGNNVGDRRLVTCRDNISEVGRVDMVLGF